MKIKKYIFIPILVVLCIILYAVFAKPAIETHTWVLSMAQKAEPFSVVAHKTGYDFSDDDSNIFAFSKEIELTCTAKISSKFNRTLFISVGGYYLNFEIQ